MPGVLDEKAVPAGSGAHTVVSGDSLSSLALENGFFWETLWNHGDNKALKEARVNPHLLVPGDHVAIPALRKQQIGCQTDQRHRFRRKGVPSRIRFKVLNGEDKPMAGKRYKLVVGPRTFEGKTDAGGVIFHYVDADQKEGEITVWPEEKDYPKEFHFLVKVSHMEPVKATPGLKTRLNHLGVYCGEEDGTVEGDEFRSALVGFQLTEKMEPSGKLDQETLARLAKRYGV